MYPMKIIQKNMRSVGKIEFDKPRLITDGLTELNWITRLVLDEKRKLIYGAHDCNISVRKKNS